VVRLDLLALEQISAGVIQVSQRQGRLYPYPQNLQLGYDRVVLGFLLGGKPEQAPSSLPEFYNHWCEKPFEEWGVEVDTELDLENTLLFLGEPTELAIELAEAFGGSVLSQEQSKIASTLLQRCQSHSQGVQIYTKIRRFIIEHPVLSNQALVEAKGLCRKQELRIGNPPQFLFVIGQLQKVGTLTLPVLEYRLFQLPPLVLCEAGSSLPTL